MRNLRWFIEQDSIYRKPFRLRHHTPMVEMGFLRPFTAIDTKVRFGPEASNLIGCKSGQTLQRIRPVPSPICAKQSVLMPLSAASICDKTARNAMQVGSMLLKNLLE